MNRTGRLLFPALRWSDATAFEHERDLIERALRIGVGGFTIFGGPAEDVCELTTSLRERSGVPLLIASDVERGAGQQFPPATQLPPLAAIGHIDDLDVTRRAGSLTACESLAVGVNWLYAPVADVDLEPLNPIIGSRAFGSDPERVAAHVTAWIEGAHAEGALCCAKHFPGHGRTVDDSHAALPRVTASRTELDVDIGPFRAAIAAGVDSLMTAHVVYDALDGETAATLSHRVLTDFLREELDYDGLVVSDALIMEGMLQAGQGSETRAAIAAVAAGCDALLYPSDLQRVAEALEQAVGAELDPQRVAQAIRRIDAAALRVYTRREGSWGSQRDCDWADGIAGRALIVVRGTPRGDGALTLLTIDDDLGGPFAPPARTPFEETLRQGGADVHAEPTVAGASGERHLVIAIYADIRAWKGTPGLSQKASAAVRDALAGNAGASIVFFGHPRLAADVPGEHVLCAWGGEEIMQRAAARWLTSQH